MIRLKIDKHILLNAAFSVNDSPPEEGGFVLPPLYEEKLKALGISYVQLDLKNTNFIHQGFKQALSLADNKIKLYLIMVYLVNSLLYNRHSEPKLRL